ncbi:hypothetical protein ABW19_dt0207075 [Dactylella cylindrospora]|nr:hypothetical protein ABW19_dt0207075 [Dactylella cylindrospora]
MPAERLHGFFRLSLQRLYKEGFHHLQNRFRQSLGIHPFSFPVQRQRQHFRRLTKLRPLFILQRELEKSVPLGLHPSLLKLRGFSLAAIPLCSLSADSSSENQLDDQQTTELLLLAESDDEVRHMDDFPSGAMFGSKFFKVFYVYIRLRIIEPIATAIRFLHLTLIFVPVIACMPIILVGARQMERDGERTGTLWWYGFLVRSMERAGPTFIKLGQWAASRTDIFPSEMCSIMSTLHSNVAAHPLSKTKEIVEKAFDGRPFDSIFQEFDEVPLGVGAIAQVYRAKLSSDLLPKDFTAAKRPGARSLKGSAQDLLSRVDTFVKSSPPKVPSDWVAIKVLHPDVDRLVRRDLRIMRAFASLINAVPTLEWLSLPDEVEKFGEMMRLQLDLRIEAGNIARFRDNFKYRNTVAFPAPYIDYTTRQVLVEEFASGVPLEDFLMLGGGPYQNTIADMGLDAFLHMLLIDNFAHADLHPGNILVRFHKPASRPLLPQLPLPWLTSAQGSNLESEEPEHFSQDIDEAISRLRPLRKKPKEWQDELEKLNEEGYMPQLIFIDTGLVTELSPVNRQNFLDLFTAVAEFNGYRAGELMVDRCRQPSAVRDKDIFCLRMQHLVLGVKSKTFTLGKIRIADILNEVMSMIRYHHVRLEGDFINVVIGILLLEGIGRRLDPNIDIFKSSLPILRQLGAQRGPEILNKDVSILKIWLGLELRTILSSSIQDVDDSLLVKYLWSE